MGCTLDWTTRSVMDSLRHCPLIFFFSIVCFVNFNYTRSVENLGERQSRVLVRPLSCFYNKTGETGICMFALNCYKANGTPLTTCRDGIFLGSCCRLPQSDNPAQVAELPGNDISPNTSPGRPSWEWTYYPSTSQSTNKQDVTQTSMVTSVVTSFGNDLVSSKSQIPTTATPTNSPSTPATMSDSELLSEIVDLIQNETQETEKSTIKTTTSDIALSSLITRTPLTKPKTTRPTTTQSQNEINWQFWGEPNNFTKVESSTSKTTIQFKPSYQTPPKRPFTPTTPKIKPIPIFTLYTTPQPQIPPHRTTPRPSYEPQATTERTNHVTTLEFDLAKADFRDACGRTFYKQLNRSGRIEGGNKSEFGKWPWQVSLRQWKKNIFQHKCGATLLNENWAITAAHCVIDVPVEHLQVRIGDFDVSKNDEPLPHVDRQVQLIAKHPDFNPRNFENDLALVRFFEPVTFQENIVPVCIPQNDNSFVNSTAYVTGWGRLYNDGPLPYKLYEAKIPIISNLDCEKFYRKAGYIESIPDIFICAGRPEGGVDSCEGDSGGPMVIRGPDKRWVLAGIISWGIGCAEPNQPGVYTRISRFRDWINAILVF